MRRSKDGNRADVLVHHATDGAAGTPSFAELREVAMEGVRRRCGDSWTDHNLHDPGITMLEAALWAIMDVVHRVHAGSRRTAVSMPDVGAVAQAGAATLELRAKVSATLLDNHASLQGSMERREPTRGEESVAIQDYAPPGSDSLSLAALQQTVVSETGADASQVEALVSAYVDQGRQQRLHDRFAEFERPIARALAGEPSGAARTIVDALESSLGFRPTANEIASLLARRRSAPPRELVEDEAGRSRAWPPHPTQVLDHAPSTPRDLAERAHHVLVADGFTALRRVWCVNGAVRGLAWDGQETDEDAPLRPGALSLLFELEDNAAATEELPRVLLAARQALGLREGRGAFCLARPRDRAGELRPVGAELHFGAVRRVPLRVLGEIEVEDALRLDAAERAAERCVIGMLDGAEGAFEASVPTGFEPGGLLEADTLQRLLVDLPEVEAVRSLALRRGDGVTLEGGRILGPFEVPDVARIDTSGLVVLAPGAGSRHA